MRNKYSCILTKEFLEREHVINKKTPSQIAKEVGCNNKTVTNYLNLNKMTVLYSKLSHGRKNQQNKSWKGYEDISLTYWNNLIHGAKTRHIPFSITIEQAWELFIQQNRKCALTGREIGFHASKNNSASLDRIDSTQGYLLKNIQWVDREINFAKQSLNNEQFLQLCQEVVFHLSSREPRLKLPGM